MAREALQPCTRDTTKYVPGYRLFWFLGSGSIGARQETHYTVAIKSVRRDILTAKLLDNLQSEIEILKSLSHRHITKLIDIVVCGIPFLSKMMVWTCTESLSYGHEKDVPTPLVGSGCALEFSLRRPETINFVSCTHRSSLSVQNATYSSLWNIAPVETSLITSKNAVASRALNTPQLPELPCSTIPIQGRAALTRWSSAAFCVS